MHLTQLLSSLLLLVQARAVPVGTSTDEKMLAAPVRIPIRRSGESSDTPHRFQDGPNWAERRPSWKRSLPPRQNAAVGTGPVGTQDIINRRNTMYTVPIDIGTPPQSFEVQLDTGSNGLWVHTSACQNECPRVRGFDRGASASYNTTGARFRASYVATHIDGEVGTDTITLGGYTVPGQEFGVALDVKGTGFKGSDIVGILGMGWPIKSDNKFPSTTPWWVHALEGKGGARWPKPMFGIALRVAQAGKNQQAVYGGELTLGGVDSEAIMGGESALRWLPVSNPNAWEVFMDDLVVGGASILKVDNGRTIPARASLDTGTAGLMGPFAAVKALYARIPGSFIDEKVSHPGQLEYYRYPCDSMPEVDLTFGGTRYALRPEDMWQYRNKHNQSSTEETCLGNIFGWAREKWIIGDAAFHTMYVAFQHDPPAIGFGKLV
ncbi:acid protease [Cutaneotrichosporon oleaginosum]|uniref:Acid protease n=1 Tax=Cutaneotrichosporon oleaginosum TaxID=879819 RepID=A0A0J0XW87_9TREE|nr:acid protease [Cutaneotrichosporon oleaginosum]KLT45341.1 acid protease [Cutaneotrichosporon oleaginosum]TXT14832.1 hypothetical protein COLE_01025 [Cutaneotrichosporon oleaginosum]